MSSSLTNFYHLLWISLELFGTFIFALSGAISAARKEFDLVGIIVVAFIVGNGGGTLRDVLIDATPVFWMSDSIYTLVSLAAGLLVFLLAKIVYFPKKFMIIADAIGLGVFAIVGAKKALSFGINPFDSAIMGVMTGIFGGILRDLLCSLSPLVLRKEIYALAAFIGAIIFVLLPENWQNNFFATMGCVLIIIAIRLTSYFLDLHLPQLRIKQDQ